MKRIITMPELFLLAAVSFLFGGCSKDAGQAAASHTVLSCNIRVALPEDDAAGHGWAARRDFCAGVMRSRKPDIICMQEVLRVQNEDLKKAFPEYAFFGFEGPEMDAHKDGAYHGIAKNVIMFSIKRYELVACGGFWLSETPHLPGSLSWGTARARHVNWVRLKDRVSGVEFRVLDTHLDHKSRAARKAQIKLILDEGALYPADFPQIFAGDFNAHGDEPVYDMIKAAGWADTYDAVYPEGYQCFTAHAFHGPQYAAHLTPEKLRVPLRIDHIYMRGAAAACDAEIITDSRDGKYPSDHYFVSTIFRINNTKK